MPFAIATVAGSEHVNNVISTPSSIAATQSCICRKLSPPKQPTSINGAIKIKLLRISTWEGKARHGSGCAGGEVAQPRRAPCLHFFNPTPKASSLLPSGIPIRPGGCFLRRRTNERAGGGSRFQNLCPPPRDRTNSPSAGQRTPAHVAVAPRPHIKAPATASLS